MAILVISTLFFCQNKINFNHKNYQNIKKQLNTTKPLKRPPITAKMTKMHHECLKYPKTLENGQNTSKTTIATPKNFKMTKILLKPKKKKQNTLETFENDQNTPKRIQNTLNFQNVGGILVSFKLLYSF